MTDERFESTCSDRDQRRILELELVRIQKEASAARLEARAAEIELLIRQLGGNPGSTDSHRATDTPSTHSVSVLQASPPAFRFSDWKQVRAKLAALKANDASDPPAIDKPNVIKRIDSAATGVTRPHLAVHESQDWSASDDRSIDSNCSLIGTVQDPTGTSSVRNAAKRVSKRNPLVSNELSRTNPHHVLGDVAIESQSGEAHNESRRGKPSVWLVSSVTHAVVLVMLAAISLQTQRPKDQIALTASASASEAVAIDSVQIESSIPETEPAQPVQSELEYELSPVGELTASDFLSDTISTPVQPLSSADLSRADPGSMTSAAAMSVKSHSDTKIQFCGVEGGGNHFVYLVDSSGSMGAGFESARRELLASVQVLKPDQRFYVVFFDAESDYMRLENTQTDDPRSAYATAENKAALKRWAMQIKMDRGRAPYDPLRFALKLKPDVIFLLSDGEFPQGIEDLLKQENKVQNLFGESRPISIVHTIGYHSKEGESRMRRIAEQNKGQYRYIPKP